MAQPKTLWHARYTRVKTTPFMELYAKLKFEAVVLSLSTDFDDICASIMLDNYITKLDYRLKGIWL